MVEHACNYAYIHCSLAWRLFTSIFFQDLWTASTFSKTTQKATFNSHTIIISYVMRLAQSRFKHIFMTTSTIQRYISKQKSKWNGWCTLEKYMSKFLSLPSSCEIFFCPWTINVWHLPYVKDNIQLYNTKVVNKNIPLRKLPLPLFSPLLNPKKYILQK